MNFPPNFSHCDGHRNNICAKDVHNIVLVLESKIASEVTEADLFGNFKCFFKTTFDFCEKETKEVLIAAVWKFHVKSSELLFHVVVLAVLNQVDLF